MPQTERQTENKTDREIDRQTDRQTDRQGKHYMLPITNYGGIKSFFLSGSLKKPQCKYNSCQTTTSLKIY